MNPPTKAERLNRRALARAVVAAVEHDGPGPLDLDVAHEHVRALVLNQRTHVVQLSSERLRELYAFIGRLQLAAYELAHEVVLLRDVGPDDLVADRVHAVVKARCVVLRNASVTDVVREVISAFRGPADTEPTNGVRS